MLIEPGTLPALNPLEFEKVSAVLADRNLEVRVLHFRNFRLHPDHRDYIATVEAFKRMSKDPVRSTYELMYVLDPLGGNTICELWFSGTDTQPPRWIMQAEMACHPEDHYCKRIGRTKALGELLHEIRKKGVGGSAD